MSSRKFNPAELLKLSINRGNNDHMRIFHEFEVKSSELLVLPNNGGRNIIGWRIFHRYGVLEPKPNCLNYGVSEGARIIEEVSSSSRKINTAELVELLSNVENKNDWRIFNKFGAVQSCRTA